MRCNRKTSGFAVTPHEKIMVRFNITKILQLRRKPIINRLVRTILMFCKVVECLKFIIHHSLMTCPNNLLTAFGNGK